MILKKHYYQKIKKPIIGGLIVGLSLALITNVISPQKQSITLADSSTCQTLSVGDKLSKQNRKQTITHLVPVDVDVKNGTNLVFAQGSTDGIQAFFLSRDSNRIWRAAHNQLAKVKQITKRNETIYDWTPSGVYAKELRTTLVILFPANSRLNHTIVPVGLEKRSLRAITYYPSKVINGTAVSPFIELINGLPKGMPVSSELNIVLNEHTASGDILIPSVFRHEVKMQNLKIVSDFPRCD